MNRIKTCHTTPLHFQQKAIGKTFDSLPNFLQINIIFEFDKGRNFFLSSFDSVVVAREIRVSLYHTRGRIQNIHDRIFVRRVIVYFCPWLFAEIFLFIIRWWVAERERNHSMVNFRKAYQEFSCHRGNIWSRQLERHLCRSVSTSREWSRVFGKKVKWVDD